jgi:hypothetical protein
VAQALASVLIDFMNLFSCDRTIVLPAAFARFFRRPGGLRGILSSERVTQFQSNSPFVTERELPDPQVLDSFQPENIVARLNAPSQPAWRIPPLLKVAYTAFMAAFVPLYWRYFGPTDFLYFCNVALILTWIAIWPENALLISMCAVGIVVPQLVWAIDFASVAVGFPLIGMTNYMFDPGNSLFLRLLSLFHAWLPFLLVYLIRRTGYDRRGFWLWTALSWGLLLICFFAMPPPTPNPQLTPVNINYVWGLNNIAAQTWVSPYVWLAGLVVGLLLLVFAPAHFLLARLAPKRIDTRRPA